MFVFHENLWKLNVYLCAFSLWSFYFPDKRPVDLWVSTFFITFFNTARHGKQKSVFFFVAQRYRCSWWRTCRQQLRKRRRSCRVSNYDVIKHDSWKNYSECVATYVATLHAPASWSQQLKLYVALRERQETRFWGTWLLRVFIDQVTEVTIEVNMKIKKTWSNSAFLLMKCSTWQLEHEAFCWQPGCHEVVFTPTFYQSVRLNFFLVFSRWI